MTVNGSARGLAKLGNVFGKRVWTGQIWKGVGEFGNATTGCLSTLPTTRSDSGLSGSLPATNGPRPEPRASTREGSTPVRQHWCTFKEPMCSVVFFLLVTEAVLCDRPGADESEQRHGNGGWNGRGLRPPSRWWKRSPAGPHTALTAMAIHLAEMASEAHSVTRSTDQFRLSGTTSVGGCHRFCVRTGLKALRRGTDPRKAVLARFGRSAAFSHFGERTVSRTG